MKRIVSSVFAGICLLATLPTYANIAEGTSGNCTWVIDNDGNLSIFSEFNYEEAFLGTWEGDSTPWGAYRESITTVAFTTPVQATTCASMFKDCTKLNSINFNNFYTNNVTDMSNMFANCTSLKIVEFDETSSAFDDDPFVCYSKGYTTMRETFSTSEVTTMAGMFYGCKSLQSFYLPNIDIHSVEDFSEMFAECLSLESMDLTTLTVQSNANVSNMFKNCKNLMNITNQSIFPSYVEDNTFLSLPTRGLCSVDVPLDCLEDYEAANGWRHLFSVENGESSEASFQSTAISNVKSAAEEVPAVYALNGNQLSSPVKGINIIAGKKVAVK